MGSRDPRVDAYIAKSADFAHPILEHLRDVIHDACPNVEESIKWSCPHYMYKGMLCATAAFKGHCALHFWKGAEIIGEDATDDAMGQFGRITSVKDLPSRTMLTRYVRRAMKRNEERANAPKAAKPATAKPRVARPAPDTPPALASALRRNAAARRFFETLSPSHKRDYIEWITEAKTEPTREKRIATTVEWLAEGKSRNWKYEKQRG